MAHLVSPTFYRYPEVNDIAGVYPRVAEGMPGSPPTPASGTSPLLNSRMF